MEKRSPSFIRAMLPNFSQRLVISLLFLLLFSLFKLASSCILSSPSSALQSLPQAFLKNLTGERLEKAVLVSPLGKWEVKVHGNLNSCLWFGDEGWSEFVSKHGVSIGDFIMFEQKTEMVFNVTILDNTACSKSYASLQETNNVEGRAVKSSDQKKNKNVRCGAPSTSHNAGNPSRPTFTATMFSYNLNRNFVAIPPQFKRDACLGRRATMKIKDSTGMSWPVNIYHGRARDVIGKGWLDFAEANKLEIGDVCTFEFVSSDLMEVHVSKHARK